MPSPLVARTCEGAFVHYSFVVPALLTLAYPICAQPFDVLKVRLGHPVAPLSVVRRTAYRSIPRSWRRRLLNLGKRTWMVPEGVTPPQPINSSTDRTGVTFVIDGDPVYIVRNVRPGYFAHLLKHVDDLVFDEESSAPLRADALRAILAGPDAGGFVSDSPQLPASPARPGHVRLLE